MFGKLDHAKEAMLRQFSGQFDYFHNTLVYRPLSKGQPIRVLEEERDDFVAAFKRFADRALWVSFLVLFFVMISIVALDESGLLPMPDWIPVAAVFLLVPLYFIAYRRALTAPLAQLAGRAPMSGERSREELQQVRLRQMPWYNMIVPVFMGAAISLVAAFAKPEFRSEHPYVFVGIALFGAFLLIGGGINMYQKWRAER